MQNAQEFRLCLVHKKPKWSLQSETQVQTSAAIRSKNEKPPRFGGVKLKNGRTRDLYWFDLTDQEIRKVENWEVLSHQTTGHSDKCSTSFWDAVRKDFRELHTTASLTSMESEYQSTLTNTGLIRKGPEWIGEKFNESAERQSAA